MSRTPLTRWSFRVLHTEGVEHSDPAVTEVTIPHDAVLQSPRRSDPALTATGYFPGGAWEYTTVLRGPESWRQSRVALEFEAVYRSASVFVNGELAGSWKNGYSSFSVSLDPFLRHGADNTISVRMHAHRDSRWYSGGGLLRPVHLRVTDPVHIPLDGVFATTPEIDDEFALVQIDTTVRSEDRLTQGREVRLSIRDADGALVTTDTVPMTVAPGDEALVRQRVLIPSPRLWSPESPYLYSVAVELVSADTVDEERIALGIRSLRLDAARGLRVNGRPVKLRGACVHHDNGVIGAVSIARAEERRVQILKAAGFNALRSAHQPMSRAMLDACDRVGMLVMDELSDVWTRSKSDHDAANDFTDWWERDLDAMVHSARTHPSVFAYSIGNEIPEIGTRQGAIWSRRLATRARELDPTRFVTSGVNGALIIMDGSAQSRPGVVDEASLDEAKEINGFMMGLADKMNALAVSDAVTRLTAEPWATVDIAGMNYLDARYAADRDLFPHRVIVGSETFPTNIDRLWALVTEHDHVIGDFTWTGWDYLGEPGIGRPRYAEDPPAPPLAEYPWILSWAGDIDITGERRPASFYREIVYGMRAAPFIAVRRPETRGKTPKHAPWSWSECVPSWTWPGLEGESLEVEVYSDADEVELFVDGRSYGRRATGPAARFTAVFTVEYAPGTIEAVAVRSGGLGERMSLRTASPIRRLALIADRAVLSSGPDELAYIAVEVLDEDGVRATDVQDEVRIEVTGAGRLQGFGSAAPVTTGSYVDARHDLFDGRALAVIRPTEPGSIIVRARADGHPDAVLTLTVR